MNQAKYDSLPADLKKVIDANSGVAASQMAGKIWDGTIALARKSALDHKSTDKGSSAAPKQRSLSVIPA